MVAGLIGVFGIATRRGSSSRSEKEISGREETDRAGSAVVERGANGEAGNSSEDAEGIGDARGSEPKRTAAVSMTGMMRNAESLMMARPVRREPVRRMWASQLHRSCFGLIR